MPTSWSGPEAAHLNISGVSGLATKTSAIEWLLQSIFAHFPAQRGSVAAVCFNVKGPDLCFLDQPGRLDDADRELYDLLQVPATPFTNVHYFAPYTARGHRAQHAAVERRARRQRAAAHVGPGRGPAVRRGAAQQGRRRCEGRCADRLHPRARRRARLRGARVHAYAPRAVVRRPRRVVPRGAAQGRGLQRRHVAHAPRGHDPQGAQPAVEPLDAVRRAGDRRRGRVRPAVRRLRGSHGVRRGRRQRRGGRAGPRLRARRCRSCANTSSAATWGSTTSSCSWTSSTSTPRTTVPTPTCARCCSTSRSAGRYLGLVLFGAQQFRSQVHRRVVGNAGTTLYGRMDADELATPGYQVLSPAVKARLATLDKGQLMVRHPHFAQPVFVRFPRPAVMTGREGVERFPQAPEPSLAHGGGDGISGASTVVSTWAGCSRRSCCTRNRKSWRRAMPCSAGDPTTSRWHSHVNCSDARDPGPSTRNPSRRSRGRCGGSFRMNMADSVSPVGRWW